MTLSDRLTERRQDLIEAGMGPAKIEPAVTVPTEEHQGPVLVDDDPDLASAVDSEGLSALS